MRCRTLIEGAPQVGKARVGLNSVTTVGLDLVKHVFQIHAVDADGKVVTATSLRRKDVLSFFAALPACVIGLEACGSAHHWARELVKLGHVARLMPPNHVKAYVRRQKNDAADAAAICEAVTRPSMRFVPIRTIENQAVLMHHKVREILVSQRTQLLNAMRGHLAEVGIIAAQGRTEPTHWPQRLWRAIAPYRFACGTPSRRSSVSCKPSTTRSPRATAPSWSWQRRIRQLDG
jgi:transposase